ncbi:hypothetical protein [Clostridium perfringens]|uniref:hypothetical protein n=1 Tax=Clostridium perfringens TaxID=1502 RepID=UPI00224702BA|nr:hypothetical protein [Clostridium perfringens]
MDGENIMAKKKTHEEFVRDLNKIHGEGEYIPLEKYINNRTKILVKHKCGYEWKVIPYSLLIGQGCQKCAGNIKRTTEEFKKEVYDKYGNEYEILGEYINAKTKIKVRHNCEKCNYYEWLIDPSHLLRGQGCPVCGKIKCKINKTKTHEDFIKEIKEKYGNEYDILGEYINAKTKILVKHNCGYEWSVNPSSLLSDHGCPRCAKNCKIDRKEFLNRLNKKWKGKLEIIGAYTGYKKKIKVKHYCSQNSSYTYLTTPSNLLNNKGNKCPKCAGILLKTDEEFKSQIEEIYGKEYTIMSHYKNVKTKILVRHNSKKCNNYTWYKSPSDLLAGYGCPVCAGREVIVGVNDIATTHPELVKYFVNQKDIYENSFGSNKKVKIKCPDCGYEKNIRITNLMQGHYSCTRCSDGISYPEKFIMSVLEQLELKYIKEYSPNWIKPKRYDFHIPKFNMIIEAHGEQHYKEASRRGRTLKEEKQNDKYKREIALANSIKHYVELDCRESNLEWIKNSVLNSELASLFDLNNINWNKCAEFANKNILKEAWELWNKGIKSSTLIGWVLNLSQSTIRNYLKKGEKLKLCSYNVFDAKSFASKYSKDYKTWLIKFCEDLTPKERVKYNIDEKLKELENK